MSHGFAHEIPVNHDAAATARRAPRSTIGEVSTSTDEATTAASRPALPAPPGASWPEPPPRGRIVAEILIVLGLSLGASAVYSVVAIINRLTQETALGDQTATLNPSRSDREIFDLIYQLLAIGFDLVPVALVCWLLWRTAAPRLGRLGIDRRRPWSDLGWGAGLALAVGIPGLAIYLGGRALGITAAVNPTGLAEYWWTVPVLLLSAARAGITEEVIMIGYLFARLRDLGWRTWPIILLSAGIRGTYHLYQGFGSFVANLGLGILFGWFFARTGRVLPLVIAHGIVDAVVFVGYPVAAAAWPALFGLPAS